MYIVDEITHYCNLSLTRSVRKINRAQIDYYDFTFVLDGHMIYRANNTKYVVSKNDAIFLPPGTFRSREANSIPIRYVSFNFQVIPGISLPFREYMPDCITPAIRKIISTFPQAHLSPHFHSREKCAMLLNHILYELMDAEEVRPHNEHIRKIISYIEEHIHQKITLSDVSSYVNLSKEYTSALFKKEMGMTLTDYINKEKLSIAKELIQGGQMMLTDVAAYVGFEDYNYFSHLFKEHFSTSPKRMEQLTK